MTDRIIGLNNYSTTITYPSKASVPQEERNLEPISLVATPRNFDEILAFTKGASTPADATVAAMMAWNLAAKYHKQYHKQGESHD